MSLESFVQNGQNAQAAMDQLIADEQAAAGSIDTTATRPIGRTDAPVKILTPQEAAHYAYHEGVITEGLETFVKVGTSLAAIRAERLYRAEFDTFEDYCAERWGMSVRQAQRILAASNVVQGLADATNWSHLDPAKGVPLVLPATESQARPLVALPPEQQRDAWAEAVETAPGGKVTARHVQDVVNRRLQKVGRVTPCAPPATPTEPGAQRLTRPTLKIHDAGTRAEQILASVDAAIAKTRELLDQLGTADSVATTDVTEALRKLDNFKDHLSRVEKLQAART